MSSKETFEQALQAAIEAIAAEDAHHSVEFMRDESDLRTAIGAMVRILHRRGLSYVIKYSNGQEKTGTVMAKTEAEVPV